MALRQETRRLTVSITALRYLRSRISNKIPCSAKHQSSRFASVVVCGESPTPLCISGA
ncbi:hypothetical protein ACRALDRAFT_1061929, partial [Sodiomyces alcalophilus JCM 7366]|uniref:uncharacterized protein n=1 Tax=Sodiomyces alcalophilus JCM 7366 TaxID=591952 RepID=UPI0039B5CDCC